jgi:hypothetical protein
LRFTSARRPKRFSFVVSHARGQFAVREGENATAGRGGEPPRPLNRLLFASATLFDLDHLTAVVPPAVGTNVMRPFELPAVAALDEVDRGKEDMAPPVALAMAADSLLG